MLLLMFVVLKQIFMLFAPLIFDGILQHFCELDGSTCDRSPWHWPKRGALMYRRPAQLQLSIYYKL